MNAKVPILDQCTLAISGTEELTVERLADYLARNSNLVFPHRHNFYHCLLFTEGAGQHSIDFESFAIEPWQIYFMAPGQIHSWDFQGTMQGYVINFEGHFFKNFLLRADYLTQYSFFSGLVKDEVFVVDEGLRASVVEILNQLLENGSSNDFARIGLLYFFSLLEKQRNPLGHAEAAGYNHTLLRNFFGLIEQHYKTLRLPKDYAALLYITPNHLNALVKEMLGKSAGDIIRNRVLLEAKRLLVIKDYAVREIAYALNFNDNSYFTKFFKKIEGITPEEFRRRSS